MFGQKLNGCGARFDLKLRQPESELTVSLKNAVGEDNGQYSACGRMRLYNLFLGESDDDGYCSKFTGKSVERPYTASVYDPVRSNLIAVVERRVRT